MKVKRISNYDELYHHGIKGQKWGVRRYQNPDGSLTAAGQKRYGKIEAKRVRAIKNVNESRKWLKDDDISKEDKKDIDTIANKRIKTYDDYYKNKQKALTDPSHKKSDEYKSAIKAYRNTKIKGEDDSWITIGRDAYGLQKNRKKSEELEFKNFKKAHRAEKLSKYYASLTPEEVKADKKRRSKTIINSIIKDYIPVVNVINFASKIKREVDDDRLDYYDYRQMLDSKNK